MASMGEGHRREDDLGWDVGRTLVTRRLALKIVPGFLMRQLVGHLVMDDEWNHLTQTPGMLGLRKTEGLKAGQLVALQSAGRHFNLKAFSFHFSFSISISRHLDFTFRS